MGSLVPLAWVLIPTPKQTPVTLSRVIQAHDDRELGTLAHCTADTGLPKVSGLYGITKRAWLGFE